MSKLYVCLLYFSFFLVLQVEFTKANDKKYLSPIELKCLDDLGYNVEIIQTGKDTVLLEGDPKLNEYFFCVWKKNGFLNDNGSINFYKLQRTLEKKLEDKYDNYVRTYVVEKTIKDCRDVTGNDDKDACVKVYNCLMKQLDENIKLVDEQAE